MDVVGQSVSAFTFPEGKGGTLINPSFDAVEGNQFQVVGGKNIVVTHLAYEATGAQQRDGTTAIFDQNGTMLASATITAADSLVDGYYYKEIAPLTLNAGSTYYVGSLHGTGAAGAYIFNTNVASKPSFILDLGTCAKRSSTIEGGTWSTPRYPSSLHGQLPRASGPLKIVRKLHTLSRRGGARRTSPKNRPNA